MRTLILTIALLFLVPISLYASAQPNSGSLAGRVAELEAQVEELSAILQFVHVETEEMDSLAGPHWIIEGVNVHVRSGSGSTYDGCGLGQPNCESLTGLGNVIVGYNEPSLRVQPERTGSHNLVVGVLHSYSSYGGLVAGRLNTILGAFASVSGGPGNVASGFQSSVSGGQGNRASGFHSSVSGGIGNRASGIMSSVTGGSGNEASGQMSSVTGGSGNEASGSVSSVSGGVLNEASGIRSSVSGGQDREAPDRSNWAAGELFEPN